MNKILYLSSGHCLFTAYRDMQKALKSATDGFGNYPNALLADTLEIMDFAFEPELDPFYKKYRL